MSFGTLELCVAEINNQSNGTNLECRSDPWSCVWLKLMISQMGQISNVVRNLGAVCG